MQATTIINFLMMILLQMNLNCAQTSSTFSSNNLNSKDNNLNTEDETLKYVTQFSHNENNNNIPSARTFYRRRFYRNPCLFFGRENNKNDGNSYTDTIQPRFLWGTNVYNIYTPLGPIGCGGGLPFLPGPYNRFGGLLSLVAPGVLRNSLAATIRPQILGDIGMANEQNALQNNQLIQNNEQQQQLQQLLPLLLLTQGLNPVSYNSFGAPPLTPAQLIGGISTTVNDVIQRLVGTAQPVYPTFG